MGNKRAKGVMTVMRIRRWLKLERENIVGHSLSRAQLRLCVREYRMFHSLEQQCPEILFLRSGEETQAGSRWTLEPLVLLYIVALAVLGRGRVTSSGSLSDFGMEKVLS